MGKTFTALASGLVFGLGIALSGMVNPAKVLNFFDVGGTWDPSLGIVMASALAVALAGYRILFAKADQPMLASKFYVPTSQAIDTKLIVGSVVFGIGWGISGFCPGGAVPALGVDPQSTAIFVFSMAGGIMIARTFLHRALRTASSWPSVVRKGA